MDKAKHQVAFCTLYATFRNKEEAKKIALLLLKKKLIACANIIDGIHSMYEWQNSLVEDNEVLLLAKTVEKNKNAITKFIHKEHSYQVPCITFLPIISGLPSFLNWIDETTNISSVS